MPTTQPAAESTDPARRIAGDGVDVQKAIYEAARFCNVSSEAIDRFLGTLRIAGLSVQPIVQWRDIETAPKTGKSLLLGYTNDAGMFRTVRGKWMSEQYINDNWEEPENGVEGWYEVSVEADDVPSCWYIEPTHWQPLPLPPSSPANIQGDGRGS